MSHNSNFGSNLAMAERIMILSIFLIFCKNLTEKRVIFNSRTNSVSLTMFKSSNYVVVGFNSYLNLYLMIMIAAFPLCCASIQNNTLFFVHDKVLFCIHYFINSHYLTIIFEILSGIVFYINQKHFNQSYNSCILYKNVYFVYFNCINTIY